MKLPAPTYSGRLPPGFRGFAVLDTSRAACLLSDSGDRVIAYAWHAGTLKRKYDLPRLDLALTRNDSLEQCGFSLTDDVDGDGIDELLVAVGRTISKYKLINGTLALTAVASIRRDSGSGPLWMTDGFVGDIDNDGRNEVLISATEFRPPAYGGDSWSPVILFVCRWNKDTLVQLSNDGGVLKLEQPDSHLPSEQMWAVADPRNIGTKRLILLEGEGDDVHAALFREVEWRDGRFRDDGTFWLRHGLLQRDQYDGEAYNAATGCQFGQARGKTAILADIFDGDQGREELFVFAGDSATQHLVLWPGAWTARFTDLDGNGTGILRVPGFDEDGRDFVFYRF